LSSYKNSDAPGPPRFQQGRSFRSDKTMARQRLPSAPPLPRIVCLIRF